MNISINVLVNKVMKKITGEAKFYDIYWRGQMTIAIIVGRDYRLIKYLDEWKVAYKEVEEKFFHTAIKIELTHSITKLLYEISLYRVGANSLSSVLYYARKLKDVGLEGVFKNAFFQYFAEEMWED